jgi:2-methylaconitate cis-trans-isomerase PrpF
VRDRVLLAAMGSPDLRQIDGLGGADTLTSKVAIVSKSTRPGVDIDYLFAQVDIGRPIVDTAPSCGNMLAGVAPFAIETGMFPAQDGETHVMIFNVNTEARIEAIVQTPGRAVKYTGDARIDGVPGTAAPIVLNFMDVVGSVSGRLMPTGNPRDVIDGIEVSCVDVAMPMIMMRAKDFGLTGYENRAEINGNKALFARIEPIRLEAGRRMGFGDVSDKVIPKVGLLSPPRDGGTIASRYLTPHALHAAHAVTGAVCVASACALEGTVAHELAKPDSANPRTIRIEHPSGQVDVLLQTKGKGAEMDVIAGTLRTARPIMKGEVLVPREVFGGSRSSS